MIDIKFLRENPDVVKENIRKKFQDSKLPLVDEVIELDDQRRATQQKADSLRADRNKYSKQIGALMGQGKKEEAEQMKQLVTEKSEELAKLEAMETEIGEKVKKIMMTIPNIIDDSVTAIRLYRILRFLIIPILWRSSTVLILTAQDVLQATVSIISWVILQGSIRLLSAMREIL